MKGLQLQKLIQYYESYKSTKGEFHKKVISGQPLDSKIIWFLDLKTLLNLLDKCLKYIQFDNY
jgi:hypothetical protein